MKSVFCSLLFCSTFLLASLAHADVWPRIGKTTQRTGKFSGPKYWNAKTVWNAQLWGNRPNNRTTPCTDETNFYYVSNVELDRCSVVDGTRVPGHTTFMGGGDVLAVNPEMDDSHVYFAKKNWSGSTYIYAFNKNSSGFDWVITNSGLQTVSLLTDNGKLYVKYMNNSIKCYNTVDGSEEWSHDDSAAGSGDAPSGMIIDPDGTYLYYKSNDGPLNKLDVFDGTFVTNIGLNPRIHHQQNNDPVIDSDGNLYAHGNLGGALPLMSFTRDGEYRWSVNTIDYGGWGYHSGITLNSDNSTVYTVTKNGLMAIDNAAGSMKWFVSLGKENCDGGCIYNQDTGVIIMVALLNGKAHAVGIKDNGGSGMLLWKVPFGADTVDQLSRSYPIVFQNGNVLLCNYNMALMCIEPLVGTPLNVSATDGDFPDKVVVSWSAAGGAVKYKVLRNSSGSTNDPPDMLSDAITGTSYQDTTPVQGQVYYYWVQSADAADIWGDLSEFDSGYSVDPTAPRGTLSVQSGASGSGSLLDPFNLGLTPITKTNTATLALNITVANATGLTLSHIGGSSNFFVGPNGLAGSVSAGSSDLFEIKYTAAGVTNLTESAQFTIDDAGNMPALTFTVTATAAIMPGDVIIHRWSFNNDDSETVAVDSVGGMDGTYVNSVLISNNAAYLAGGGDYNSDAPWIDLPEAVIDGLTNFTIETFFTPELNAWNALFCSFFGGSHFDFSPGNGYARAFAQFTFGAVVLNTPHHMAIVYTRDPQATKVYVDGILAKEQVNSGANPQPYVSSNVFIGGCGRYQYEQRFKGWIDEFRMYNGALDAEVIRQNSLYGPDAFPGESTLQTGTVTEVRGAESGDGSAENPWNMGSVEIDDDPLELDLRLTISGGNVSGLMLIENDDTSKSFDAFDLDPDINDGGSDDFTVTYTPTNPVGIWVTTTYTVDDGPGDMIPVTFHVTARPLPEPGLLIVSLGFLILVFTRIKQR